MKKRFLASLLAFAMLLSLLPASALAAGEEDGPVYGFYDNGNWEQDPNASEGTYTDPATGVQLSKTAVPVAPNTYEITLQVVTSTTTTTVAPSAAATVLVIDVSGSMKCCAECGQEPNWDGHEYTYLHSERCKHYTRPSWENLWNPDNSVQADQTRLYAAKQAAISFLDAYRGDTEGTGRYVAVVSFSRSATTVLNWTDVSTAAGYNEAEGAINRLNADGGTNLEQGLNRASSLLDDEAVSGVESDAKNVIALTDGAPTYYGTGATGPGSDGCPKVNEETANTANALRAKASVYTVCFGVANKKCWERGWQECSYCHTKHSNNAPTVGEFLADSVASPGCAHTADDTAELNKAFEAITETIVGGIPTGGLTVTDNMGGGVEPELPAGVDLVDGSFFTWDLGNPEMEVVGGTTYYTYTLTYTVTLDPTAIADFDEDAYYPLNGETTLNIPGYNPIQFPVPAVKGVLPVYTVTYEPGTNGTLAGADADGNVVTDVKYGTATPAAPAVTAEAGYYFVGWAPDVAATVTGNATYVAQYAAQTSVAINGESASVTYDGEEHTLTGYTHNLPEGYTLTGLSYSASGTVVGDHPGTFSGTAVITDENSQDVTGQFAITTLPGTLTINARPITIQAEDASKVYDGTPLTEDGWKITSGTVADGQTITSVTVSGSQTEAGASENKPSNAVIEDAGGNDVTGNYSVTYVSGTLTVNRDTNATIEATGYSGEYDGQYHDGVIQIVLRNSKGEEISQDGWTITYDDKDTNPQFKDAGTYSVIVKATNANYNEVSVVATVTIGPRKVTLTSPDQTKMYDGTALVGDTNQFQQDGFVAGEGVTFKDPASITNVGKVDNAIQYTWNDGTKASNYAVTLNEGKLTVTKNDSQGVSLEATAYSGVYDGAAHELVTSSTVTGAVASNVWSYTYSTDGVNYSETMPEGIDAGEYPVWVKASCVNYEDLTVQVEAKISPRKVTLTSPNQTKMYDGTALVGDTNQFQQDGFVAGEGVTFKDPASITNVGKVDNAIQYTWNDGTKASNYAVTLNEGKLEITASTSASLILSGYEGVYDGESHTVTERITGDVEGTVWSYQYRAGEDGEWTTEKPVFTDAGTYTVYVKASNSNYVPLDGYVTVNITKRTVELISGSITAPYTGTALTAPWVKVDGMGFVPGEGADYSDFASITNVGEIDNEFTYKLWDGTVEGQKLTKESNYDIRVTEGLLKVTPYAGELGLAATPYHGMYDGDSHNAVTSYGVTGDTVQNTVWTYEFSTDGVNYSREMPQCTDVNEEGYPVWVKASNPNYPEVVMSEPVVARITPRTVVLTSGTSSKTYDGNPLTNYTVTPTGDGFVKDEGADYSDFASITNVGEIDNEFRYKLWDGTVEGQKLTKAVNYNITQAYGTLTVTKNGNENGDVKLEAEGYTGTYDGLGHDGVTSQKVTGAVEGNAWTYLYSTDGVTYSSEMPQFTDAGSYTVYVKAVCDNYADLFTSVTVTITPAPLTVVTPDAEKTYDGTPLTAKGSIEGFVNSETATFRTTGTQTDAGSSRNSYELIWDGTAKESNYTVSETVGTLTVNRAKVTITVDDKTKTYGEDDPAFTGTVAGLIGSDDLHVVYTRAAGQENAENVGSVTLTANYTANSNYEVAIVPGTLTILPKAVTVTANDAGKTYGTADPEFTAVVAGLIEGESEDLIRYTLSREAGENVGEYAITPAGETLQGNYTVTYIAGVFTISPAEVTITVDSKSKIYGEADPAFTGTVVDVIDGDDLHVVYARADADAKKENVGDDITITASYDANSNYTVTVIPGKLTILPADGNAVNVTSYAGKYDGESHSVAAEALKEGSTLHYSTDGTAWSETLPTFTDVGEYTVYVYATNPNYKDTETVSGTVIITKRAVTLTSATDSKVYDGTALTNGTVTVGGDGFVKDEGADYDVTGSQTKIGSSENTFTYSLKDNTKAGNYDITTVNGTLTVTAASNVTVTKTAETNSVTLGGAITWKVTVTNNGDADAKDLCLTDSIQGVTITGPEGVDYRCFDLKAGESITFTVTYKPTETGVYVNHVEVSQPKDGGDGDEREKIDEDDSDPVYVTPYYPPYRPTPVNKPTLNTEDHVAYIIGYEDGTVKPEGTITRAEVATIFFRLLTDESREEFWSQVNPYLDVAETAWYNNAVSTLHAAGIIVDSETGFFRPDEAITRAELAVMAAQFTGLTTNKTASFTDVPLNHWAAGEIALVEQQGWINGYEDGTFRPDATITRAETMAIINRMLKRAVDEDHMLRNMVKWIDNPVTAWYYEDVQEATNSHSYVRLTQKVAGQGYCYEDWQEILAVPDWAALENLWATANSK